MPASHRPDRLLLAGRSATRTADSPVIPAGVTVHQIGEVAERVGLSLRTVRYYEEVGLVVPSGRTQGGFRLYTDDDIDRLGLVKRMKPLGFTLEQMRDLLQVRDRLAAGRLEAAERAWLLEQLSAYAQAAAETCARLRAQLAMAEEFADTLRQQVDRHDLTPEGSR